MIAAMKIHSSVTLARRALAEKFSSEILADLSARIQLCIAVPSTTTLGELMEMLYWAKGWEPTDEVIGLSEQYTIRHYGFKVSVKAEYVSNLLVMLYASNVNGFVFEE